MSDNFQIPAPHPQASPYAPATPARTPLSSNYRTRRAPRFEPGMRAVTLGAALLGGVLVLAAGGWAVLGHRSGTVPVIEADSQPVRVKPTDPGGLQVAGPEDQLLGDPSSGADRMAPAAEAPAPMALRAQMKTAEAPAAAPPPAVQPLSPVTNAPLPGHATPEHATPEHATPGHAAPTTASPLADTPAPAAPRHIAAEPTAKEHPPEHPLAHAAAGGTMVQLAALRSHEAAETEWRRLAHRMPELLSDRHALLQRAESGGHEVWRVRTGGFPSVADATGFCGKVRARGGSCTVATF